MIALEHLKQFCSTDRTRAVLCQPFSPCDDFTYATDGRCIARVPGLLPGVGLLVDHCWATLSDSARRIAREPIETDLAQFRPLPAPSALPAPVWVPCDSCEGAGCDECDMTGKWDAAKAVYDVIFGTVYNVIFLHRVQALRGDRELVCALGKETKPDHPRPLLIRPADGRDDLSIVLMPVREPITHPFAAAKFYTEEGR